MTEAQGPSHLDTSDAPEIIYAYKKHDGDYGASILWLNDMDKKYYRADIVDALRKERDEWKAQTKTQCEIVAELNDDLVDYHKEVTELKAKLATARRDAIQECAKFCDNQADNPIGSYFRDYEDDLTLREIAKHLRAMIDKDAP